MISSHEKLESFSGGRSSRCSKTKGVKNALDFKRCRNDVKVERLAKDQPGNEGRVNGKSTLKTAKCLG